MAFKEIPVYSKHLAYKLKFESSSACVSMCTKLTQVMESEIIYLHLSCAVKALVLHLAKLKVIFLYRLLRSVLSKAEPFETTRDDDYDVLKDRLETLKQNKCETCFLVKIHTFSLSEISK